MKEEETVETEDQQEIVAETEDIETDEVVAEEETVERNSNSRHDMKMMSTLYLAEKNSVKSSRQSKDNL